MPKARSRLPTQLSGLTPGFERWGLISLVIANLFTIVMNLVALVQARRVPPPQLSSI